MTRRNLLFFFPLPFLCQLLSPNNFFFLISPIFVKPLLHFFDNRPIFLFSPAESSKEETFNHIGIMSDAAQVAGKRKRPSMYLPLIDLLVLCSSSLFTTFFFGTFSSPFAFICSVLFVENHLIVIYALFWEHLYIPFLCKIVKDLFFPSFPKADAILNSFRTCNACSCVTTANPDCPSPLSFGIRFVSSARLRRSSYPSLGAAPTAIIIQHD